MGWVQAESEASGGSLAGLCWGRCWRLELPRAVGTLSTGRGPRPGSLGAPPGEEWPVHSGHRRTFHGTGRAAPVRPPMVTLSPSGWGQISLSHPLIPTWSERGAVPHHCQAWTKGRVTTQPPLQAWSSSKARIGASRTRHPRAARCFLSARPQGLQQLALLGNSSDCRVSEETGPWGVGRRFHTRPQGSRAH